MIVTRRTFLAAAGATAISIPAVAAAASLPGMLRPDAMRSDLALLRAAYEAVHPGLRRYLPPDGFAERIEAAQRWADRPRTSGQFFLALARLTAAVRCGHSYPNPSNHSRAARAVLLAGRNRAPFTFRWIAGRMIVTGARGAATPLPPGTEILALDDVPARRLLAALLPLARADGSSDAKRVAQMGLDARERYAAFDVYRPLLFPPPLDGIVRARLRAPGGRERVMELPALAADEVGAKRGPDDRPAWTFAVRDDGMGLLTMPDWVTYRSEWNWRGFIDEAVDQLIAAKARGLVVDLRGNEGGTECGWHLLGRLIGQPVPLPGFDRKVRYRALPADLRGPLDTWDPRFRDWGELATGPDDAGFYDLRWGEEELAEVRPHGRRFEGKVAVLIDATCSSATFQFANAVKAARLAPLVGETTGGNRRGINGGAYFFVRLPGSEMEVDLPVIGYFARTPQPDAGVVPDRPVAVTAADLAAGVDRPLAAALSLFA